MPNNTRSLIMAMFGLVMIAGVAIGVWPVHVTVLGTEGSCGLAPMAWINYHDNPNADELTTRSADDRAAVRVRKNCADQGIQRLVLGAIIVACGWAGLVTAQVKMPPMLLPLWGPPSPSPPPAVQRVAPRPPTPPPPPPAGSTPPPRWD